MDLQDLIHELSIGIRLPSPEFCPQPIATLMKHCFYADPYRRPDFTKIKGDLESAHNDLMGRDNSNVNVTGNEGYESYALAISTMNDNTMKSRYDAIKSGNQKQEACKSLVEEDQTLIEASKCSPEVNYLTVENIVTLGSQQELSLDCQTEVTDKLPFDYSNFGKLPEVNKTYKHLFYASNELRRYYSCSGEGTKKQNQQIKTSKSEPKIKHSWA